MVCPDCGYVMTAFDKACPRCKILGQRTVLTVTPPERRPPQSNPNEPRIDESQKLHEQACQNLNNSTSTRQIEDKATANVVSMIILSIVATMFAAAGLAIIGLPIDVVSCFVAYKLIRGESQAGKVIGTLKLCWEGLVSICAFIYAFQNGMNRPY